MTEGHSFIRPDEIDCAALARLVPPHLHDGVTLYVTQGIIPGHFLQAVICNDLLEACGRADETSARWLPDIVKFFYNYVPSTCWKTAEAMRAWARTPELDTETT